MSRIWGHWQRTHTIPTRKIAKTTRLFDDLDICDRLMLITGDGFAYKAYHHDLNPERILMSLSADWPVQIIMFVTKDGLSVPPFTLSGVQRVCKPGLSMEDMQMWENDNRYPTGFYQRDWAILNSDSEFLHYDHELLYVNSSEIDDIFSVWLN